MAQPSSLLVTSFTILSLLVAAGFPLGLFWAMRRLGSSPGTAARNAQVMGAAVVVWLAGTFTLAAFGKLSFGPMPPPIFLLLGASIAGALVLSLSKIGTRLAVGLPMAALVGWQAFRLPLELLMHRAYAEGVMPIQMSYSGSNFDIVSGASAVLVGMLLAMDRMPAWGVRLWNWMGALLLLNIVTIAVLSTPGPLRRFTTEPPNVWVTTAPFVWLPSVMVVTAFVGHVLVARRLRHDARRVRSVAAGSPQHALPV